MGNGSHDAGLSKYTFINVAAVATSEAITSAAPKPAKVSSIFATIRIIVQKPISIRSLTNSPKNP